METKTAPAIATAPRPADTALAVRPEAQIVNRELNRLAYEPASFVELEKWADKIWNAGIIPESITKKEHVFIIIATGRELGMSMMQSLRWIFIVNGRVGLFTAAMVAMVQQSPICEYFETTESTNESCTVRCKRRNAKNERVVTFTKEDAIRAGLWSDPKKLSTWGKYPRRMLLWRAQSEAAMTEFADVANGLATIEVLRDDFGDETAPTRELSVRLPSQAPPEPLRAFSSAAARVTAESDAQEAEVDAQERIAAEPPHDRITGEVLDASGAPEQPEAEHQKTAQPPLDPVVAELRTLISVAKDGPSITAARDAITEAIKRETISAIELKPLVVLLLARCANASDRNRVSGMILSLREANKVPEALLADLRTEFERARANGTEKKS